VTAWHERQIARHLDYLVEVRDRTRGAGKRLEAVLEAYALISHEHHGNDLAVLLHRGEQVARAHQQLRDFFRDLIIEGTESGDFRADVAPDELASYCLHALAAASGLPSKAAVRRLVRVTLTGLRPSAEPDLSPGHDKPDDVEAIDPTSPAHHDHTHPHGHTGPGGKGPY
jgi:hypothetical protein